MEAWVRLLRPKGCRLEISINGWRQRLDENWLGLTWRSVETMRYVVRESGQNDLQENNKCSRVLKRSRTSNGNLHRIGSEKTGCTSCCKTCAVVSPDRQRSFQRVLRVGDCNLFVRKLMNRLKPFGAELLQRDPLIHASLALCHSCCFSSVRVGQLPQSHLHRVPVQVPSSYFKD